MSVKLGIRALKKPTALLDSYAKFDNLDGHHPWMDAMPDGYVSYQVRELQQGEVAYFNFALAKEMGLIATNHSTQLTANLRNKILKTFSIQIINEYDEHKHRKFDPATIKPHRYMASRYLQLQHSNKKGKTSGDGRGIWNGVVQHQGTTWDVSSRGTGVTCLAPGAVAAKKPLKTGGTSFGYGCGLAEIDELYGAAIFAEIMHLQGIPTERVLCVIDLGNGHGIGVRAAPNLLRPAHLFRYLKQNRWAELKKGTDYFIERQKANGKWPEHSGRTGRYDRLLNEMQHSFAEFSAKLDIDYIFAWLDWDGDNVLMEAGILDYGSVRQFGIRHDHYRYDDVERFSTNLNEQRTKARLLVQVFAQMVDFIKTGKRRALKDFASHPAVTEFNKLFSQFRADRLLYRMGFNRNQRELILKESQTFTDFDREFSYFERAKISGAVKKVPDGINQPALFNMGSILKELPEFFLKSNESLMPDGRFFELILSQFARRKDAKLRPKHSAHIQNFQRLFLKLVKIASHSHATSGTLQQLHNRTQELTRVRRITGNALIQIVDELMGHMKKGMSHSDMQKLIDQLVLSHVGLPEVGATQTHQRKPRLVGRADVFAKLMSIVDQHREDI